MHWRNEQNIITFKICNFDVLLSDVSVLLKLEITVKIWCFSFKVSLHILESKNLDEMLTLAVV